MKKQKRSILVLAVMVAFITAGLFLPGLIGAGNMYAPVEKTGQSTSYATGDDGDLQKGVAWPVPRFTDNGDGTVTDNLTGLMWLADANCINSNYPGFDTDGIAGDGRVTWQHALDFVAVINDGTYSDCGGGRADWRLPSVKELQSLIDFSQYDPALPTSHPFTGVQSSFYWSSTTYAGLMDYAWYAGMVNGNEVFIGKSSVLYVWPVRDGVSDGGGGGGGSGGCFIPTAAR
jgi:hypothetical protein